MFLVRYHLARIRPKPGPQEKRAVENVQDKNRTRRRRLERQQLHHYQQGNRDKCSVSGTCGGCGDDDLQQQCQQQFIADLGYTEHNIQKEGISPNTSLQNASIP